ncbi:MAG TPA: hypothetical protein VL361_16715 [Candidatus Limnocylindrales bacterium]|nr:hypothetical protein [Candidatus Limnocylindrales bacterium]
MIQPQGTISGNDVLLKLLIGVGVLTPFSMFSSRSKIRLVP